MRVEGGNGATRRKPFAGSAVPADCAASGATQRAVATAACRLCVVIYRLLTGAQVKGTGGGPVPTVDVEDATKPTEALKESVDEDVQELNDRLYSVEERLERLQPPTSRPDREE